MSLNSIEEWHRRARPTPDDKAFNVQLGCHFEEVAEMIETIKGRQPEFDQHLQHAYDAMHTLATYLKGGEFTVTVHDRKGFLDSLADQIVTGVGTGYCAGMQVTGAASRVDESNWSKFVGGRPVFHANGKIAKPVTYKEPDLEGLF